MKYGSTFLFTKNHKFLRFQCANYHRAEVITLSNDYKKMIERKRHLGGLHAEHRVGETRLRTGVIA